MQVFFLCKNYFVIVQRGGFFFLINLFLVNFKTATKNFFCNGPQIIHFIKINPFKIFNVVNLF